MPNRILSLVKPLALCAVALAVISFSTSEVRADPVIYSTTGVFTGTSGVHSGSGTNAITFGPAGATVTFTFNGVTLNPVNTPTGASFGDIVTTIGGAGYTGGPASASFSLNFDQAVPCGVPGTCTGSISGNLAGSIAVINQTDFLLTFAPGSSVTINGITYTPQTVYIITPPTTGAGGGSGPGTTSIQGTITGSAIPEPATLLLLGTGLTGIAARIRSRRKAK